MATFAPISYKYVPTGSRSKKTDSLDAPRLPSLAAVDSNGGQRSEIQAGTGTFYSSSDGDDFPTIEEILYTTLQKDGFTTVDSSPENTVRGVGGFALGKRDDFLNHSGLASGDDLGGSPDDPIVLLGNDDSNASEAEAEEVSLRAESAAPGAGLVNSPETAVDSTIPAPPCSPNGWHDIDDFPETAPQQEVKQSEDNANANDENERPQQEANDVEVTAEKFSDTHISSKEDGSPRSAERQQSLPTSDPSPEPSQDGVGSASRNDDELNDTDLDDDEEPRPLKQKRPSSFSDGLTYKRRKHCLPQRSTRQRNLRSKPYRRSPKSHYPPGPGSRATATPSAKAQLPSPARSTSGTMDAELLSECSSRPSIDVLPTLTEITFRPQSLHCFSFTAIVQEGYDGRGVSFSQLAQLVESIGYVGKIDDFTIKPLQQHSFLVTGLSRHMSPGLMSTSTNVLTQTKANRIRAVNVVGPVTPREIEPYTSGESDSDHNSNNDDDGCSSEDEQDRLSTRKKIPWDPLDEQRLQAYMKENKSWSWIFKSFPQRTPGAGIRLLKVELKDFPVLVKNENTGEVTATTVKKVTVFMPNSVDVENHPNQHRYHFYIEKVMNKNDSDTVCIMFNELCKQVVYISKRYAHETAELVGHNKLKEQLAHNQSYIYLKVYTVIPIERSEALRQVIQDLYEACKKGFWSASSGDTIHVDMLDKDAELMLDALEKG